jgi:hypothetical protein
LITLIEFLLFILASSFVIVGWFVVSRGEKKERVDGKIEKEGSLFKGWEIFWYKKKELPKKTLYTGNHLFQKMKEVRSAAIQLGWNGHIDPQHDYLITTNDIKVKLKYIEYLTEAKIRIEQEDEVLVRLFVYKVEPDYVFPEVIRMPIAGCVTCHASIYGSVIFWSVYFLWDKFQYDAPQLISVWIAYIFSVAVLNTFIYKHIN